MIIFKNGDLLSSKCDVICHQVNCQGVMGSGVAKQIRDRYPIVYQSYLNSVSLCREKFKSTFRLLGTIDFIKCETCAVVNMYSQYNYLPRSVVHTDYPSFRQCLKEIKKVITDHCQLTRQDTSSIKIGFPYKIGCGLAGGDWNVVSKILESEFSGNSWNVEIWEYSK